MIWRPQRPRRVSALPMAYASNVEQLDAVLCQLSGLIQDHAAVVLRPTL